MSSSSATARCPSRPPPRRTRRPRHPHHLRPLPRPPRLVPANVLHQVFVRCRCTHEWEELDLTCAYFDLHFTGPEHEWENYDDAITALGFDGLLAGTIWS
ncbi:hypothetical protein [Kitasatospora sp. NPDC090308]|uniref:hypothetical protein n=1 Tax=Kitasatospora sp. NPDC090308 TaxID=3364082 RepID=UPI00381E5163